jgi:hypothetical protein
MNMKICPLPNWEAFEKIVASKRRHASKNPAWQLLFRGQRCPSWKLLTTLERRSSKQFTPDEYYHKVLRFKPEVESRTGKRWDLPTHCPNPFSGEYWNYLVYLRHHDCPSPLLDWSSDENVAAFFAFRNPQTVNSNVAIFLYVEFSTGIKVFHESEPRIRTPKCNVPSVSRHVNQKTKYTLCMTESNDQFCSHEDVFRKNQTRQDLLIKYLIPASERHKVLKKLHSKGITEHFLLESDDTLTETLPSEKIDLDP